MSIRFREEQVRPTGRATMGVKGIEVEEGDRSSASCVSLERGRSRVLAVCERGYGKQTPHRRVPPPEPRRQGRHPDRRERAQRPRRRRRHRRPDRRACSSSPIEGRCSARCVSEIRETGRNAQGVRLMDVEDHERIVAIDVLDATQDPGGTASNPPPSSPPDSGSNGAATESAPPASGEPPPSDA
jgi:DNA gyrase subunit A